MTQSRTLARLLLAIGAAITALALLAPAASAAEPNPGYEQFAGCPSEEEASTVFFCQRVHIDGGHFKMGSKNVPIKNPMDLVAGITDDGDWVDGELEEVKQEVPGGIIGLTGLDWLINLLNAEQLKVYAITEIAATPGNAFVEPIFLPIKVRLVNPILGNNCYVGSGTNPIKLNLQLGETAPPPPNEPIKGVEPDFSLDEELNIIKLTDGQFVDNSFAAPAAKGCVLNLGLIPVNIDALVNLQSGLPSAAGTNETRQNFDIELTETSLVYGP